VEIELAEHDVYRPDLAGWKRSRVPNHPTGRPIRVRPDWVCEVLSPTTAARDLGPKLSSYHHAEIPHYWIVAPEHSTLTVYRFARDGYLVALSAGADDVVRAEPLDAVELPVGLLFGRDPDD
jgi:Uma2 family endonuclease